VTQIDVSRDATVMSVRLLGDADARTAWRVLDAIEAAVTIAPGLPIRIDLTGAGRISPTFAAVLARIVHAWQGAGRAVSVLVPDLTARAGPVEALLRPVASPAAVAM
jgi:ABC-type transporter Mla MlaB component